MPLTEHLSRLPQLWLLMFFPLQIYLGKVSSTEQAALAIGAVLGGFIANISLSLVMWLSIIPNILLVIISLRLVDTKKYLNESGNIYSHFSQKIGCITGFFIALFFLLFAREFLYPVKFISNFFIITYLIIIGFFVYLVFFTQLFVLDTFMKEGIIYTTFDSFWYIIWATMLSIPFIVGLFILQKKLRASDGVIRRRLYIMLSFVLVAVMGGMLFDVILVYWNNYQFDYIAPVFSIFLMYPMAHMIFISKR